MKTKPKLRARRGRPVKGDSTRATAFRIARIAGVSEKTAYKYLRQPDAPQPDRDGCYDAEAASAWVWSCVTRNTNSEIIGLRAQLLRINLELRNLDAAEKCGRLVRRSSIQPTISEVMDRFTSDLQAIFENELPRKYHGREAAECRQLNAEGCERALRAMWDGWRKLLPHEVRQHRHNG